MTVADPAIPTVTSGRNPFGVVAIALAALLVLVNVVSRTLSASLPALAVSQHLSPASLGALLSVLGVIGLVVALATTAIGVVGVTRPGQPHALAAAGMAIGIFAAASYALGYLLNVAVIQVVMPR